MPTKMNLMFIDSRVSNYGLLISQAPPNTRWYVIDSNSNGLEQIARISSSYSNLSAIHIISHGSNGALLLGNQLFSNSNISNFSHSLNLIGSSLSASGDILLYGCDVGTSSVGNNFINTFSKLTGADVAASSDKTGVKGDWLLESTTGKIESITFSPTNYQANLGLITGTDKIESLIGTNADDVIMGLAGRDTLNGLAGNDTLIGGEGDDYINDMQGNNSIDGSEGNDWIVVDEGIHTINGGSGADTLSTENSQFGATVQLKNNTLQINFSYSILNNIENYRGSKFNDNFNGDESSNTFWLSLGSDFANGAEGGDRISARFLSTSVVLNAQLGVVNFTNGNTAFLNFEDFEGSNQNDTLTGDDSDNFIMGRGGNDTLDGGLGYDWVDYREAMGAVKVNLLSGTSSGADGTDTIKNFEYIRGSAYADTLVGDKEDNMIRGMAGNDTINGGAGSDWSDYRNASGSVTVSLVTNKSLGADGSDTLVSIENIRGSDFGDVLIGNGFDNRFRGMQGNDTIQGGSGSDRAEYSNATAAVTVVLTDTITPLGKLGRSMGADGKDVLYSIEGIRGSDFDDVLIGNSENNFFRGMKGDDSIFGGLGLDTVDYGNAATGVRVDLQKEMASGADGEDVFDNIENAAGGDFDDVIIGSDIANNLLGKSGSDTISAGAGNDTITGGLGTDRLTGDGGFDIFNFDSLAESNSSNRDRITDFASGSDKIDLLDIDANQSKSGDQAFLFNASKPTTAAAYSVWYKKADVDNDKVNDDLILYGDVNGNTAADFEVALLNVSSLKATDFFL